MKKQVWFVLVWKNGVVNIAEKVLPGSVTVASSVSLHAIKDAVEDACTRRDDGFYFAPEVERAYKEGKDGVAALEKFQRRFEKALKEAYR